jgi:hypothetical protein
MQEIKNLLLTIESAYVHIILACAIQSRRLFIQLQNKPWYANFWTIVAHTYTYTHCEKCKFTADYHSLGRRSARKGWSRGEGNYSARSHLNC